MSTRASPTTAVADPGVRPDLDTRAHIERMVRDFYRDVAMDDLLGPVFAAEHVDWSVHIPKLADFWAKQLLGEPGYEGQPLRAHVPVHARTPFTDAHYERWLALFVATVDDGYEGPYAEDAKTRARRLARALRLLLESEGHAAARPGPRPSP